MFFSRLGWGYVFWRESLPRQSDILVTSCDVYLLSIQGSTVDADLGHPVWGSICQVSYCKVPFPLCTPSFHPVLFGGQLLCAVTLGVRLCLLKAEHSTHMVWNSAWESSLLSSSIFPKIYWYQYSYYFILWVNPNTSLFCCSNCSTFGHWGHSLSFWLIASHSRFGGMLFCFFF